MDLLMTLTVAWNNPKFYFFNTVPHVEIFGLRNNWIEQLLCTSLLKNAQSAKKFLEFFAYTKYDSINLELLMEKYFHNFLLFFNLHIWKYFQFLEANNSCWFRLEIIFASPEVFRYRNKVRFSELENNLLRFSH